LTAVSVQLNLPKHVLQRLQRAAEVMQRPLDEVIEQTILGNLPPTPTDVPPSLQDEFASWQRADNQTLWRMARETLPPEQWTRREALLDRQQEAKLSEAEQQELAQLREKIDLFVMHRSYVLALLKRRGHAWPAVTT
jgi:hypothetical protein